MVALIQISRPLNVLITSLSVIIGGVVANYDWPGYLAALLWAALSAGLIAAGGNAYNDYCDRDLDRIQKPHRPIPSGRIRADLARNWSFLCFLAGVVISVRIGRAALLIAVIAVVLLLVYNRYWKRQPFIGNLAVSVVAALAFIYGGAAVESIGVAVWATCLAFFFHLGREIVKDLEDAPGDAAAKADTLVVRYGLNAGRITAGTAFLLLCFVLPLPHYWGPYHFSYLIIVLLGVLPVLVFSMIVLWQWSRPEQWHRLSVILKWDMFLGLFALFLGRPSGL